MKQQIFLTFPQQVLSEPLIYILGRDFSLVPNIKGAMITDQMGMMALEVDGAPEDIERAIQFLRERGVKVDGGNSPATG
jgi:ABC-type methionine transport system ATPase subunit